MKITVAVGKQNGKPVLVGLMAAADIISHLQSEALAVNERAQRSLAKGTSHETTKELLQDDRVHTTPRMKSFISFMERVMTEIEKGEVGQGFFGAIQLVVPK